MATALPPLACVPWTQAMFGDAAFRQKTVTSDLQYDFQFCNSGEGYILGYHGCQINFPRDR